MMDVIRSGGGESDPPQPSKFWGMLNTDDKMEFLKLRTTFHRSGSASGKDRRVATFQKELRSILLFLERDSLHGEERSIVSGIAFAGPFICVNTRQLKAFLGRCKSSINGSFQQMGYVALRTKTKARNCIATILKPLIKEQAILRQWTVRCAARNAQCCFVSSFPVSSLPQVTEADLVDDHHRPAIQPHALTNCREFPAPPPGNVPKRDAYSVECLADFDDTVWGIGPVQTAMSDDETNGTVWQWDIDGGMKGVESTDGVCDGLGFAEPWIQF